MEEEKGGLKWRKGISPSSTVTFLRIDWRLCATISVTIALFLILVIMVPLKFSKQDKMLKELETKADNLALSLNALPSRLQQKGPQESGHKDLTEIKSALTNLKGSITSLSSEQHNTANQQNTKLNELGQTVTHLSQSIKSSSSVSLPSSVNTEKVDSKITKLNQDVVDLSHSVNALSTDLHEAVKHQESTLNVLKMKADTINSSLNSLPSKLQDTDEKVLAMNNMTTQILNIINQMKKDNMRCPEDWELYSSNCYFFSDDQLPWHNASDFCKTQAASLLILTKKREWSFVAKKTNDVFHWVGLTDEHTGEWRWVDGTPYVMDRRHWLDNQPDNWKGHFVHETEDCAHLAWAGKLNDIFCGRLFKYICKKAAA